MITRHGKTVAQRVPNQHGLDREKAGAPQGG